MGTESSLPTKIDKYEILGVIGRGGMGVVYKARDPHIDRIVAVKTIRMADVDPEDDQQGRLRMEARSAGKLHHPNIVTIFDFGEEADVSYIVMEFVEGVNLSRVMQQQRAIPLAAKLDVLMQISRGLAYAHECGVVHRDLKPSNICVTARGVAKILDFGLARYDNTRLTKTGYLSGTIAYMSPERFGGETGPADDIFALGAVAYEFLTYQRAFPGDTTPHVISKILGGTLPPPISAVTSYPPQLDEIVFRALERDPLDRYRSAFDFEAALNEFQHSPEYSEFAKLEPTLPDYVKDADWSDDSSKSNPNPYSSGYSMAAAPISEAPTIQVAVDENSRAQTEMFKGAEPTLLKTTPATQLDFATREATGPARSRRGALVAGAAAVILLALLGGAMFLRPDPPPPQPPPHTKTDTARALEPRPVPAEVADTASRESEVQLATASTLANLVAERQLNPSEQRRLAEATQRLDLARQKIQQRDYAGGNALISEATASLREMLATPVRPAETPGKKKPPDRPVPAPQPVVVVTKSDEPVPAPVPTPVPPAPVPVPVPVQPSGPSRADLEREIHSFMRSVATAYQEKDVSFFRERSLRFNDQQAAAIRNSPSKRVDITVRSIQFDADGRARVAVRRTDTFAEAGMSPGIQLLVYELLRTSDGWKIVSLARE